MNKAIITVVGQDTVGIIARVCTYLSQHNVNVLDISQTIIDGYFNMMMIVDYANADKDFGAMVGNLEDLGDDIGVRIRCQREEIFTKMHRIEAARSAGRLTRGGGKPGGLSTDGAILIPLMRVTAKLVFKYPVRNKPC